MIGAVLAVCAMSGWAGPAPPTALVRAWARPPDSSDSTLTWRFDPDPETASALRLGRGWEIRNVVAGGGGGGGGRAAAGGGGRRRPRTPPSPRLRRPRRWRAR